MAATSEDLDIGKLSSSVKIGKCGHAFHSSCMTKYLRDSVSCPTDMAPWVQDGQDIAPNAITAVKTI